MHAYLYSVFGLVGSERKEKKMTGTWKESERKIYCAQYLNLLFSLVFLSEPNYGRECFFFLFNFPFFCVSSEQTLLENQNIIFNLQRYLYQRYCVSLSNYTNFMIKNYNIVLTY